MKLHSTALVLLLAMFTFAGCQGGHFCMRPKGDKVTETISMADFDGIELAIDGNVTLHRDSVRQVKITGHQNIIDNIERNIKSGTWIIEYDQCVFKSGKLEIEIWLPSLTEVKITGSGNITGLDQFPNTSSLDVAITGSGNIDLDADADVVKMSVTGSGDIDLGTTANRVEASITGSGNIDVRGTCSHEDIEITGSGNIHAFDLVSETADVNISGSGFCELQVSNHLNIVITGAGDVFYKGTATVDSQTTGSGTVKHVN